MVMYRRRNWGSRNRSSTLPALSCAGFGFRAAMGSKFSDSTMIGSSVKDASNAKVVRCPKLSMLTPESIGAMNNEVENPRAT